jgi:hypothetical protein
MAFDDDPSDSVTPALDNCLDFGEDGPGSESSGSSSETILFRSLKFKLFRNEAISFSVFT